MDKIAMPVSVFVECSYDSDVFFPHNFNVSKLTLEMFLHVTFKNKKSIKSETNTLRYFTCACMEKAEKK